MEIEVKANEREQMLFKESDDQEIVVRVKAGGIFVATWIDLGSHPPTTATPCSPPWKGGHRIHVLLEGEGAQAELFGTTVLGGDDSTKIDVIVEHRALGTKSNFVWTNILADTSQTEITSRVIVAPKAQLSDAKQSIKSLLLSDTAKAIVKPQLEIRADDVSCSHGATVGALDDDALRFLSARGLSKKEAQGLLRLAFIRPTLMHLNETDRQTVEKLLHQQLTKV